MPKQNPKLTSSEYVTQLAIQAGAWVLTGTALLVSSEKLMHHADFAHGAVPAGYNASAMIHHPEPIRAEGARETARLPEEFDVGLRAPSITA